MEYSHIPVLLQEVLENLCIRPDGIYVDGTIGGGGHAYEIASRLTKGGRLIGIDRDGDALEAARARLSPFGSAVTIFRGNYGDCQRILSDLGIFSVSGILLDLGVSSFQLDNEERGFSYRSEDAPLDMRMDRRMPVTAEELLNTLSMSELRRIFLDYGEERYADSIAKHIAFARQQAPITTTGQLNELIYDSIPSKARRSGKNPCKRTYQAIRIAVNGELDVLQNSIDVLIDLLKPGGRLCIISFHSLEDRIVKSAFARNENPCTCPPSFPVCVCGKKPKGVVITKKPILPKEEEVQNNRRAKSAKLRVFEKQVNENISPRGGE